jgi:hypothetical protein
VSALLALVLAIGPGHGCTGLRPGWLAPSVQPHAARVNRVVLTGRDQIEWAGMPITRETLRYYLARLRTMDPLPLTVIEPAPTVDCALLESVRDDLEAALPCALGACGEGIGPWAASYPPSPPPAPPRRTARSPR